MNNGVFFYIIVVSYNAGVRLKATVDNILGQSYGALKVIVEDGGSTDLSLDALKDAYGTDERIAYFCREDKGIYDAMNLAVGEAVRMHEGERTHAHVLFLNCGDYLADADVLKKVAARISHLRGRMALRTQIAPAEYDINVAYGDTFDRTAGQVVSANPVMDDFACYRHIPCHQSVVYSLDILREEPFDTKWSVRADYEHFLRLKYRRHVTPRYLRMTIADYEGGGFSEQKEGTERSEKERREIIAMYLPKGKTLRYDLYRTLSLQPLREILARHPKTAAWYQSVKRSVYRKKDGQNQ